MSDKEKILILSVFAILIMLITAAIDYRIEQLQKRIQAICHEKQNYYFELLSGGVNGKLRSGVCFR